MFMTCGIQLCDSDEVFTDVITFKFCKESHT
jgi:hypothetical protein